jgi:hypothetical protein
MTEHHQALHQRLDELLGAATRLFLDKLRAVYATGKLDEVLNLRVDMTSLQQSKVEDMPTAVTQPTKVVSSVSAEPSVSAELSVSAEPAMVQAADITLPQVEKATTEQRPANRTITAYLQQLREKIAAGISILANPVARSAQTA